MSPTEIELAARNRYNAVGDSFWGQDELFMLIYDACLDMARECFMIETTYTTSTVASQREYAYPSNTISIKRIEYNNAKLEPISFREDDYVLGYSQDVDSTGTPMYYSIWDETIYLRPIPSAIGTLRIYSYNEPAVVTATSTLEIPTQFHMDIVNYVVSEMCSKDQNYTGAQWFQNKWNNAKLAAKRYARKQKRGDSFAVVQVGTDDF